VDDGRTEEVGPCEDLVGGQKVAPGKLLAGVGLDLSLGSSPAVGGAGSGAREASRPWSSPSLQIRGRAGCPVGPVLWSASDGEGGPLLPTCPLSPAGSVTSDSSWAASPRTPRSTHEPLHLRVELKTFAVSLTPSRASPRPAPAQGGSVSPNTVAPSIASLASVAHAACLPATQASSSDPDLNLRLVSFRDKCRIQKTALLPRPVPKRPRRRRSPRRGFVAVSGLQVALRLVPPSRDSRGP